MAEDRGRVRGGGGARERGPIVPGSTSHGKELKFYSKCDGDFEAGR